VEGDLSAISATFLSNYDTDTSDLSSVDFDVQNTGDIPITYNSVEVSIDGTTQTDTLGFASSLAPGQSTTGYHSYDSTVSNGNHDMTIRLMNNGKTVLTETTTVSTSS